MVQAECVHQRANDVAIVLGIFIPTPDLTENSILNFQNFYIILNELIALELDNIEINLLFCTTMTNSIIWLFRTD